MWNLRSEDRLKEWKKFRESLATLTLDESLKQTVHLWSYAPFVTHYINFSDPTDFPDPWELVASNKYDDLAKALGMLYTLYLSDKKDNEFELCIAKDDAVLDTVNYIVVNNSVAINYNFDEITPIDTIKTNVIHCYDTKTLGLERYI